MPRFLPPYAWPPPQEPTYIAPEGIAKHLPLIKHFAGKLNQLETAACDFDDFVSAGTIGLLTAERRYTPERGKFSSFAVSHIRGAMIDEVRKMSFVPRWGRSKGRVEPHFVSLDDWAILPSGSERGMTWGETIPNAPCDVPLYGPLIEEARAIVRTLPKRERQVIELYYDGDLKLREIAALIGVSEARVIQLRNQGIKRVRAAMNVSNSA